MTLDEEVKALLPNYVHNVTVTDSNIHGLEAFKVVANYAVHGKTCFIDLPFTKGPAVTPEYVASQVMKHLPNLGK